MENLKNQPFTEPLNNPLSTNLCKNTAINSTGINIIIITTDMLHHCVPFTVNWPATCIGKVCVFDVDKNKANKYSFQVEMSVIIYVAAKPGLTNGRIIDHQILYLVAPSIIADSSSSTGILTKNSFINQIAIGIAPVEYAIINDQCDFKMPICWNKTYIGSTIVTGGKTLVDIIQNEISSLFNWVLNLVFRLLKSIINIIIPQIVGNSHDILNCNII